MFRIVCDPSSGSIEIGFDRSEHSSLEIRNTLHKNSGASELLA